MTASVHDDSLWQIAIGWVMREHEQTLDGSARADLLAWLNQDLKHRSAYEEATRLWRLTGWVPASDHEERDHLSPLPATKKSD